MHRAPLLIISCVFHLPFIYGGRRLDENSTSTTAPVSTTATIYCPAGEGIAGTKCQPCPRGQFSTSGTCLRCADTWTTATTGTVDRQDCSIKCPDTHPIQLELGQGQYYTVRDTGFHPFSNDANLATDILTLDAASDAGPSLDIFVSSEFNDVTAVRVHDACANDVFDSQNSSWTYDRHGMFYLAVTGPPFERYTVYVDADCAYVPEWNSWGSCSATCGHSTQMRTRNVTALAEKEGCKPLQNTRVCTVPACQAQCETTAWSAWGGMTETCNYAQKSRTRVAVNPVDCIMPRLMETTSVFLEPCPEDCVYRQTIEPCNATCGPHSYLWYRYKIIALPSGNGTACPHDTLVKCNVPPCTSAVYTDSVFAWAIISIVVFWLFVVNSIYIYGARS